MTSRRDKLEDEAGRLDALVRLDAATHSSEASFDHITSLVRLILGTEMATIVLVEADRQRLKARQGVDLTQSPRAIAFCDITIRGYDPLVIEDTLEDARVRDNPFVTGPPFLRSYVGTPLTTAEGYNLGTLCAMSTTPRQFSEREVAIIRRCAALVMDQLELRSQVNRDYLTGAYNRRYFMSALSREMARLKRRSGTAVVAFLDIDHFKRVNDEFGHPAGDQVLRDFVDIVSSQCRESDLVARLGGEEFAVLLPDTDLASAGPWAERIREQVGAARFGGWDGLRITVSVGLVALGEEATSLEAITRSADEALYEAKRTGRNRVVEM